MIELAQGERSAPDRLSGQAEVGQLADQRGDGDLAVEARERCTETEVRARAEGEVAVGRPGNVERVRIGERVRVAVRGGEKGEAGDSGGEVVSVDVDVLTGSALRDGNWGDQRALLDGTRDEPGSLRRRKS